MSQPEVKKRKDPEMRDRLRACGYAAHWVPFPDVMSGLGDGACVQNLLERAALHA